MSRIRPSRFKYIHPNQDLRDRQTRWCTKQDIRHDELPACLLPAKPLLPKLRTVCLREMREGWNMQKVAAAAIETLSKYLHRYYQLRDIDILVELQDTNCRANETAVRFNPPAYRSDMIMTMITANIQGGLGVRGMIKAQGFTAQELYSLVQSEPRPEPEKGIDASTTRQPQKIATQSNETPPNRPLSVMQTLLQKTEEGTFPHMQLLLCSIAKNPSVGRLKSTRSTEAAKASFILWGESITTLRPSTMDTEHILLWMIKMKWIRHPTAPSAAEARQRLIICEEGWNIIRNSPRLASIPVPVPKTNVDTIEKPREQVPPPRDSTPPSFEPILPQISAPASMPVAMTPSLPQQIDLEPPIEEMPQDADALSAWDAINEELNAAREMVGSLDLEIASIERSLPVKRQELAELERYLIKIKGEKEELSQHISSVENVLAEE